MGPLAPIILLLVVALPAGWIISEFRGGRAARLMLGCLSILCSFGVAFVVGSLERFNANAWFGSASKQLIDATVSELEAGQADRVLRAFLHLQSDLHPTYENRARYDQLVERAVEEMQSE